MIAAVVYPAKATLLQIQADLIKEYGGAPGLRDDGALDAAIARPEQLHAYNDEITIFEIASALAFGLCKVFHPFVDGNKRIAFDALFITLHMNGYFLDAPEKESAQIILDIASGAIDEPQFAGWVADHTYEMDTE